MVSLFMNKNKIITISIISIISIIFIVYFINSAYRISNKKNQIEKTESKVVKLKRFIRRERKNKKNIEKINEGFLENAYFNKEGKYFENYIRNLFDKYKIKISIYQSKMTEKNYSEMELSFQINAFDFFKLIKQIEEGDKIIVIKRLTIKKHRLPYFKVTMKLGGYCKE